MRKNLSWKEMRNYVCIRLLCLKSTSNLRRAGDGRRERIFPGKKKYIYMYAFAYYVLRAHWTFQE